MRVNEKPHLKLFHSFNEHRNTYETYFRIDFEYPDFIVYGPLRSNIYVKDGKQTSAYEQTGIKGILDVCFKEYENYKKLKEISNCV